MLGISDNGRGCLFDLDGVLTQTARVRAAAWPEMFDDFPRQAGPADGGTVRPLRPGGRASSARSRIVVRDLAELLDER